MAQPVIFKLPKFERSWLGDSFAWLAKCVTGRDNFEITEVIGAFTEAFFEAKQQRLEADNGLALPLDFLTKFNQTLMRQALSLVENNLPNERQRKKLDAANPIYFISDLKKYVRAALFNTLGRQPIDINTSTGIIVPLASLVQHALSCRSDQETTIQASLEAVAYQLIDQAKSAELDETTKIRFKNIIQQEIALAIQIAAEAANIARLGFQPEGYRSVLFDVFGQLRLRSFLIKMEATEVALGFLRDSADKDKIAILVRGLYLNGARLLGYSMHERGLGDAIIKHLGMPVDIKVKLDIEAVHAWRDKTYGFRNANELEAMYETQYVRYFIDAAQQAVWSSSQAAYVDRTDSNEGTTNLLQNVEIKFRAKGDFQVIEKIWRKRNEAGQPDFSFDQIQDGLGVMIVVGEIDRMTDPWFLKQQHNLGHLSDEELKDRKLGDIIKFAINNRKIFMGNVNNLEHENYFDQPKRSGYRAHHVSHQPRTKPSIELHGHTDTSYANAESANAHEFHKAGLISSQLTIAEIEALNAIRLRSVLRMHGEAPTDFPRAVTSTTIYVNHQRIVIPGEATLPDVLAKLYVDNPRLALQYFVSNQMAKDGLPPHGLTEDSIWENTSHRSGLRVPRILRPFTQLSFATRGPTRVHCESFWHAVMNPQLTHIGYDASRYKGTSTPSLIGQLVGAAVQSGYALNTPPKLGRQRASPPQGLGPGTGQ